jgi:hypothetical protein
LFASSRRISAYFFYSACLIRNSLFGPSIPSSRTYPSCPPAAQFSYPSSSASISHVIFIPLTARPRCPAFVVRGCLPSARLAGTTAAPIGRICGHLFLHRCTRHGSNCIWFGFPTHYQRLCRVSFVCFRVRLAFAFLTLTTCMRLFRLDSYCVSAIRFSHVTCYLLLDCSLLRLLIFPRPSLSLLSKDMFLINTRKKQMTPTFPASGLFTPLPSLPDPSRSWFYDTSICSLGDEAPLFTSHHRPICSL